MTLYEQEDAFKQAIEDMVLPQEIEEVLHTDCE